MLSGKSKRVLIISPHFPPVNTPDQHRIRMSLPYYKQLGWEPVVICVLPESIEGYQDVLLSDTIPEDLEIHRVAALSTRYTRKVGFGSIAIRSLPYILKKGNELLRTQKFDLIFFSTTAFHVCALGRYWKQKFKVPFVIDLQDPWRNDFYLDKPRSQKPPKFWLAYTLDKVLEAYTMPHVAALMTVSEGYITMIKSRYPVLKNLIAKVIPFGASTLDFELVKTKNIAPVLLNQDTINVVYVGAVTPFFMPLIRAFFKVFMDSMPQPERYHFYFIGTNYSKGIDQKPIEALAATLGMGELVSEYPGRIPYFTALATLMAADILFVPGSMDVDYNASKIYNNILSGRPIYSIFHQHSLVKKIIEDCEAGVVVGVQGTEQDDELEALIKVKMDLLRQLHLHSTKNAHPAIQPFLAGQKTLEQVNLFNEVINQTSL